MLACMAEAAAIARMSPAEYLEWERQQTDKHEYHHGEIFAMAGGRRRHSYLSGAVIGELRAALRGKRCYVHTSDRRLMLKNSERYVYPDALVECGANKTASDGNDVSANPVFIVEVLSPSTESYDRGMKWEAYQRIDSLTDYLLVSQSAVRIEHFLRQKDGSWRYQEFTAGNSITLSNGAVLNVDAIYEGAFDLEAG